MQCGIVGLPNVGKSTLFNAITGTAAAEAANYPFCTIEPNVGKVAVPDARLVQLAEMAGSEKTIFAQIEIVDIAGLVRGASKGEGLGNQFLSHIREVDAIIHVLRCFHDPEVTHVENRIDPVSDAEIINLELVMADLQSVEKRIAGLEKKAKTNKDLHAELEMLQKAQVVLNNGQPARVLLGTYSAKELAGLQLITSKPILYLCNVDEKAVHMGNEYSNAVLAMAHKENNQALLISAQIESEIAALTDQEAKEMFLADLGLEKSGLERLIKSCYQLLGYITYFTVGPKEARAWTITDGTLAPGAAGVIHTDFEHGFIRAETIAFNDYIALGGESQARQKGKLRLEGKEYKVQDGDVMHFRFNV